MNKIQKIIVVGATGFTGKQVIKQLEFLEDVEVTCFVRSLEKVLDWAGKGVFKLVVGDLDNLTSIEQAFEGQDALIFVASMGFGHMSNVVKACSKTKLKRAVFTSSTAIFTRLPSQSKDGREAGEKQVVESELDWTILRPTMIYGRKGDRNIERLIKNLRKFPVFFIPGPGKALQQPVFVDDVAKATIQALWQEKSIRKAYNISGKDPLTFNELVEISAYAIKKKVLILNLPLSPMRILVRVYNRLLKKPKITEEQLLRLNENKAFDHMDAQQDFGFSSCSYSEGLKTLIKEIS